MLKENWRLISRLERIGDLLIIVASFYLAYHGRESIYLISEFLNLPLPMSGPTLAPLKDYFIVLFIALLGYLLLLNAMGAYSSMRLSSSWRLIRISMTSSLIVFLLLAASLFLLKLDLSRGFIVLFGVLTGLGLAVERIAVLEILRFWRRRGKNFRNVIICGVGDQAVRLALKIQSLPELGIRIRAFADLGTLIVEDALLPEEARREKLSLRREKFRGALHAAGYRSPLRLIRGVDKLRVALQRYAVDEVIFTDVVEVMPIVREAVEACAVQGIRTTIAADLFSVGIIQSELSYFAGMPLIHFQTPPGDRWELVVKRVIDMAVSVLLLVVLAPVFALIALAVKSSSPGPVLFKQRRVGLNGRLFDLYKFRSMRQGAEAALSELQSMNEMAGPAFKMTEDPRVTAVGKVLRRYSLDELPQLWNVLRGDMSLVGPRPPVPGEVSMYERSDRRRLSMRPGLTCTWQVSGRSNIKDFESWVRMDLEYIDNWSLWRDLTLMLRTIPAVIFGTGAR